MAFPIMVDLKVPKLNFNDKITVSGVIMVSETVCGPLDLSLDSSRCTLDMKNCEKYNIINLREVCKNLFNSTLIYSNVLASITPPLKCPILPGNYTIQETELDLAILAYAPFDGYIYITSIKLASTNKVAKTRKILFCLNVETKIVKIRVKS